MLLESGSLSLSAPHSKELPAVAHSLCCSHTRFGFSPLEIHSQICFPTNNRDVIYLALLSFILIYHTHHGGTSFATSS